MRQIIEQTNQHETSASTVFWAKTRRAFRPGGVTNNLAASNHAKAPNVGYKHPAKSDQGRRQKREFLRRLPLYFKGAQKAPQNRPSPNRQKSRQSAAGEILASQAKAASVSYLIRLWPADRRTPKNGLSNKSYPWGFCM